jgi:Flp pilus assembly protein TadD
LASATSVSAAEEVCDANADLALGVEDYATAVTLHRQIVGAHPDDALAHYHLGFAYGMLGRSDDEIAEYDTAAKLGAHQWDLFLNLGLAYLERHQPDRAIEALSTAVSLGPEHPESYFNLALAREQEKDYGGALREVAIAEQLAPDDLALRNTEAVIHAESGDLVGAERLWSQILTKASYYPPARRNLAMLRGSDIWLTASTRADLQSIPSSQGPSIAQRIEANR